MRVIVIDSDERCTYERARREQAMERARQRLEELEERAAAGELKPSEEIGAAVERVMQRYHGDPDFDWKPTAEGREFSESAERLSREQRIGGKYAVMTGETDLSIPGAVALSEGLTEVESGLRRPKDVLGMRPIHHRIEPRVGAHVSVAALALLVRRLLGRRSAEAGVNLSPVRAMRALVTVRLVSFHLEGQPERRGLTGGCPDARLVLKALELADQRPPVPPAGEETVMSCRA